MANNYISKNKPEYVRLVRRAIEDSFAGHVTEFREGIDIDLSQTFALFHQWESKASAQVPTSFYSDVVAKAVNAFLESHNMVLQEYGVNLETATMHVRATYAVSEK